MAAPMSLGSLAMVPKEATAALLGSAQVNDIQMMPVLYPRMPNTQPMAAYSLERMSFNMSPLFRYLTAFTTDAVNRIIMLNHMETWKYRLRMVSFRISIRGTSNRFMLKMFSPAVSVYTSSTTDSIFHHSFFI